MITRQVTECIGEWFTDGTVDEWLAEHELNGVKALTDKQIAMVRSLAEERTDGRFFAVSPSGFSAFRVARAGLYDGWPYWKKRICVGYVGPLAIIETMEAYSLDRIVLVESCGPGHADHGLLCPGFREVSP